MDLVKRKVRALCSLTRRQKRNIRICLSVIVITLAFYRILYYKKDETQRKLILVYTPHPSEPWGPRTAEEANSYKFSDWDGTPCEENRCQITFDKSLRNFSDAVLIHVGHPNFNIEEAKKNRPPKQRWV